jgi:hypothetical protein
MVTVMVEFECYPELVEPGAVGFSDSKSRPIDLDDVAFSRQAPDARAPVTG